MIYSPHSPYEILQNKLLDFRTIQELRRFAKYWDTIANSGNFVETVELLWSAGQSGSGVSSPFIEFRRLSAWINSMTGIAHGIALSRLVELLFEYLVTELGWPAEQVAQVMWRDYQCGGRSDRPHCLRPYLKAVATLANRPSPKSDSAPKRQARRQQGATGE